ncbi:hypothetical protein H5410_003379 [Solanum commersonii]|uniref:Uncharacterized protein n=1 Tax=Solanum commersonii TaxID=4109 RepID=A0A9J6B4I4_SOLCO|nr:hypothetical protein H5410_003379 [Solanum commersonii]
MVCKASGPLRRSWAPSDAVSGRPAGGCGISFTTTLPSKRGWNLIFRRALNDWEVTETARLLQVLNSFSGGKVLAEEEPVKITGDPSKLVSRGHCGRIEIQDVMKAKGPTTRGLEINALVYFIFGVNRIWQGYSRHSRLHR